MKAGLQIQIVFLGIFTLQQSMSSEDIQEDV